MSNSSYAPDEPYSDIVNERTWLQGGILTGVGYGVVVTLFTMCFHLLFMSIRLGRPNRQKNIVLLVYISVISILGSLFMGSNSAFTDLAFVDDRNFPGGPNAYENSMFSVTADEISNVSFVLTNWCTDALMVWRYLVVYQGCIIPLWTVALIPCLTYCASFTMGILWLKQISTPSSSPFQVTGINFTLPYLSLSLALNISVTILIVLRLLYHRHQITQLLGPGHGAHYIGIATMLIESAALYSGFALLFLVPFALGNPIANTFLQALGEIIAPLLIIFRVAQGKAWSAETQSTIWTKESRSTEIAMTRLPAIRFKSPIATGSGTTTAPTMEIHISEDITKDLEANVVVHGDTASSFDGPV
ncbi:hypothetical protein A0H81_12740 [Grifola frondosa]|uniref:Uncharacterized protein n=1 Tax=Grifola frondosa TaxID=5627 RepID=A0A1C7LSM1_GRIFR|nr:hypothetical protein A0H81_12740 [Grifola frondosa]